MKTKQLTHRPAPMFCGSFLGVSDAGGADPAYALATGLNLENH